MQQWPFGLVNSPEHRLAGGSRWPTASSNTSATSAAGCAKAIREATNELRSLKELLLSDNGHRTPLVGSKNWLQIRGFFSARRQVADQRLSDHFELRMNELLRLHEATLNAFCRLMGLVLAQVVTVSDKLRNLAADLNHLIEQFAADPDHDHDHGYMVPDTRQRARGG